MNQIIKKVVVSVLLYIALLIELVIFPFVFILNKLRGVE